MIDPVEETIKGRLAVEKKKWEAERRKGSGVDFLIVAVVAILLAIITTNNYSSNHPIIYPKPRVTNAK